MFKRFKFHLMLCLPGILLAKEDEKPLSLPIGNFSVPFISQIAPLVSFGQLLIGERGLLTQLTGAYAQGHDGYSNVVVPNVVYGIRDDLTVYFAVPFTPKSRSGSSHSSGIGDTLLQFEYGFYNRNCSDYTLMATVVANVQFPTGSSSKRPPTGNGSFSYFAQAPSLSPLLTGMPLFPQGPI